MSLDYGQFPEVALTWALKPALGFCVLQPRTWELVQNNLTVLELTL